MQVSQFQVKELYLNNHSFMISCVFIDSLNTNLHCTLMSKLWNTWMYPWHGTWSTCCMTWCMVKGCIFLSTVSLYHVSLFEVEIHRAEVSPSTSPSRIASTLGGLAVLWLGRWNRLKFLLRTWATLLNMMKVITFCGNWRPRQLKRETQFRIGKDDAKL